MRTIRPLSMILSAFLFSLVVGPDSVRADPAGRLERDRAVLDEEKRETWQAERKVRREAKEAQDERQDVNRDKRHIYKADEQIADLKARLETDERELNRETHRHAGRERVASLETKIASERRALDELRARRERDEKELKKDRNDLAKDREALKDAELTRHREVDEAERASRKLHRDEGR